MHGVKSVLFNLLRFVLCFNMESILKRFPCVVESFKNSSRNNKELVFSQNKLQSNAHVAIYRKRFC